MKTRNGKIARLPLEIRDQLNTRLADGEPGNRLVEWLNSNPAVIKVMDDQFDGRSINENNLSEWRSGGYEEWLTLRSYLDEARVLSEKSDQVAETGITSDHLHVVLLAHHAHLLQNWEIMPDGDFKKKLDALRNLTASIMNMRRAELQKARVQLQRERLELLREKQRLKSASSSEPTGVGAGGMSGQEASRSPISASTSSNARPAPETRQAAHPCASTSDPSISFTADSRSPERGATPLSAPPSKSAPNVPILSGRIQPEFPDPLLHLPSHPLFSKSDSLGTHFDSTGQTRRMNI